jgi:GGDEF domain-containing protein
VIMPGCAPREATATAETLRAAVRSIDVSQATGSGAITLTGSVGVSAHPSPSADAKTLVTRAFERMWEARNAGGNRVLVEGDV